METQLEADFPLANILIQSQRLHESPRHAISSVLSSRIFGEYTKQLLDEAEHDKKNYPNRGHCDLQKPKVEADNVD